jgi:hypothetical protein
LKGSFQASDYVRQHLRVDVALFWPDLLDRRRLGALLRLREVHPPSLPAVAPVARP